MLMPLEADHWLLEASLQTRGHPCQTPGRRMARVTEKARSAALEASSGSTGLLDPLEGLRAELRSRRANATVSLQRPGSKPWAAGRRGQPCARSAYWPVYAHRICIMVTSDAYIASEVTSYGHTTLPAEVCHVHANMPHRPVEAEIDL